MSRQKKWTLGILNDSEDDAPGTVLLISPPVIQQVPLDSEAHGSKTAIQVFHSPDKRSEDGQVVLNPQPDDSPNDPLNWPSWRRNVALLALGIYCMIGGGLTPILAAGFHDISETYRIPDAKVALTVGFFMLGLGVGGLFVSPTAILFGKRPIYLTSGFLLVISSILCAASPSFLLLLFGRLCQGIAVSAVEVLPSSTITEIFFLHERAFRLGLYTMLLLSGKSLVPIVSAAIIQIKGWRWVFWIVTMIVTIWCLVLFFFLPETYWDRKTPSKNDNEVTGDTLATGQQTSSKITLEKSSESQVHVESIPRMSSMIDRDELREDQNAFVEVESKTIIDSIELVTDQPLRTESKVHFESSTFIPSSNNKEASTYTERLRQSPPKSFVDTLRPFNGRINQDNWIKAALRPFVLFAYPAVLWSALVYSLSVGWLIVLSESMDKIYRNSNYGFSSLETGLVYLSPFVGAVLGSAMGGKMSDIISTFMARKNDGVFEPEFRLVMAPFVALSTTIGLIGFGWSAYIHDQWMIPTFFFGVVSFGCSLGSTTAITYCVDSYKEFSAEALVTLNFSKNIFHGLAFSLFFSEWLERGGCKRVFIALGCIQLGCMFLSVPMYIFGKRARRWTLNINLMARL